MRLNDRVAIITGGTSGIGLAIAKLFSQEGASVVIASAKSEKGDDIARAITPHCLFVRTDVCEENQVKSLVSTTVRRFGKLDILVNSAGAYPSVTGDITQIPVIDFDRTMNVNFKGVFLTARFAVPELLKTQGNIINIASFLGIVPRKELAIYCASKSAVIMFSKTLALQLAEKGVRVNTICPGPIETPMLAGVFSEKIKYSEYLQRNPMKRVGHPEEVARLALFLASADAGYITGGICTIDGGESLR